MAPSIQDPANLPWNPSNTQFPSRKDLPKLADAPEGAAWVWGKDDYVSCLYHILPLVGIDGDILIYGIARTTEPAYSATG